MFAFYASFYGELRKADRFWPWLYKIALNKMRLQQRKEKARRTVPMSTLAGGDVFEDNKQLVASVVSEELKQIVLLAMGKLFAG